MQTKIEKEICPECGYEPRGQMDGLVRGNYDGKEQPEATCYNCSCKWFEEQGRKDICPYCGKERGYCKDNCIIKRQYKKREDEQRTKESKKNSKIKE